MDSQRKRRRTDSTGTPSRIRFPPLPGIEGETGLQFFDHLHQRRKTPLFNPSSVQIPKQSPLPSIKGGEVIEMCGPTGGGKTELVLSIVMMVILPETWHWSGANDPAHTLAISLGGQGCAATVVDCDLRFPVLRLQSFMHSHVSTAISVTLRHNQSATPPSDADITTFITTCFTRLLIFRPRTSLSLYATLSTLPDKILKDPPGSAQHVTFLAIDSISPFFWIDRAEDAAEQNAAMSIQRHLARVVKMLKEEWLVAVVVCKWEMFPAREGEMGGSSGGGYRDGAWNPVVDRCLDVRRGVGGVLRWETRPVST
ncbi:DNA repair protein xrcc2 [Rhizophlyctis rosea]|nr:DNA repair protein xrcc2 [Rhizophlyctis rosea]